MTVKGQWSNVKCYKFMAKRQERSIISIVGRTNVGKSSMLNLLSGQKEYAIVDKSPGTTADTVTAIMEIHEMGPFKVLDTAGIDEYSELGDKKRKKTFEAIEEADLNMIVLNIRQKDVTLERQLIEKIRTHGKQGVILYNRFDKELNPAQADKMRQELDERLGGRFPSLVIDADDKSNQQKLSVFIKKYFKKEKRDIDLLPIKKRGYVFLIIPMDEETPTLRLLRPQDMAVERLLRSYAIPVCYRMDLKKARRDDVLEKKRFLDVINDLSATKEGLKLVLTDSQAFDIVSHWTPVKFPLTSFSIMMTNYMSGGNLELFVESVRTIDNLKIGDKILVVEACNHDRQCDDIATVQIPNRLEAKVGGKLNFDFSFGRPFPPNIDSYKLIIHCGGCMIDRQKYQRRIRLAQEAGIPITNYGILLSYLQGRKVLERTVKPFLS